MAFLVKRGNVWYVKYREEGRWKWKSCRTSNKNMAKEKLRDVQNREAEGYNVIFKSQKNGVTLEDFVITHLETAKSEVSKLLGHSTIAVTERYAHLAPDHLQAAVREIEY